MPLDKQNTKLGAFDVKFTPGTFNSILPMTSVYDATNTDLSKFQAHGGKLLIYHGFSDPSIVPTGTLAYYAAVVKQMGGLDATQKFARLFMFPGVYHCGSGYGPSHFDMVIAITAWVEHGNAPNKIMAVRYSSDNQQQQQSGPTPLVPTTGNKTSAGQILPTSGNPIGGSGKVIRTLPVYPYPMVPKFTGRGDVNDDRNYMPVRSNTTSQDDFKWLGQELLTPVS